MSRRWQTEIINKTVIEQQFYDLRESGDFAAIVTKMNYSKGSESYIRQLTFMEINTTGLMHSNRHYWQSVGCSC